MRAARETRRLDVYERYRAMLERALEQAVDERPLDPGGDDHELERARGGSVGRPEQRSRRVPRVGLRRREELERKLPFRSVRGDELRLLAGRVEDEHAAPAAAYLREQDRTGHPNGGVEGGVRRRAGHRRGVSVEQNG